MRSLKTLAIALAAVAVLAPQATRAADLPPLPPPPIQEFGGWYLRGDLGMTHQQFKELEYPGFATAPQFQWLDRGSFDSSPFFGLGIGYKHNSWFRWDATVEYRGKADFHALDRYFDAGLPGFATNDYTASKSEWLLLWNAYLDLGTWKSITPFVGVGIGASHNTISHFRDTNVIVGGGGYAGTASKWNLAWALHAGLSYDVTPNFTVELAYRYVDLGDAQTDILYNLTGTCTLCSRVTFKDLTSHDLKVGVRWMMADMGVSHWAPPPPIVSKY